MKIILSFIAIIFLVSCGHGHHKSCGHKKAEGGMMCGGGKSHHGHDHMMDKMDADKDGKITKAEFDKKHQEKFTEMDRNSDGVLTKEELGTCKACGKESCECNKKKAD